MRADLFFRLAGYAIRTPLLSERVSDIPELARHFLLEFGKRHQVGRLSLSPAALEGLLAYPWPGNVRELRAVVENATIVAHNGLIERADIERALQSRGGELSLPAESWQGPSLARATRHAATRRRPSRAPPQSSTRLSRPASLPNLQRDLILRAFEDSQHNLSRAALDLGIPRSTLARSLEALRRPLKRQRIPAPHARETSAAVRRR